MSSNISLRQANMVDDTTFTRIWKFYYDKAEIELRPKEEEIRQRLINIWGHLGDILTDRKAVLAHMKWCEDQGNPISEPIAYKDLHHAKMLFGDRAKQTKAAHRAIVNEWIVKGIERCWESKDMEGYAKLIARYNKVNGLEGADAADPGKWAPIAVNFNADPETLKKQAAELRRKAEAANAVDVTPESDD